MERPTPAGTDAQAEAARLLAEVARGRQSALERLYQLTSAKLFGICLRLLGNRGEAQEVLQDVYLAVWRGAGSYDSGKAGAIAWLAVVARNRAIDRLRRRQPAGGGMDEAEALADNAPSALDLACAAQSSERLAHCLEELDPRARDCIRAAFLDGQTYARLAEREAVPLATMKSWIRRGLLRLRGCLEP